MNNNGIIAASNNKKITRSARHIDIWYHHIQDLIKKNVIKVFYILSKQMTVNEFTKAFDKEKFIKFCEMIGMTDSIATAEWDSDSSMSWFLDFTSENYENIQKQKHSKKEKKKARKQTR